MMEKIRIPIHKLMVELNYIKAMYAMQTTFVCKLWKLQSGPPDQDPRGGAEVVGGEICKSVIT